MIGTRQHRRFFGETPMAQGDCAKEATEYESPHDEESQLLTFNEPVGDVAFVYLITGGIPNALLVYATASIRRRIPVNVIRSSTIILEISFDICRRSYSYTRVVVRCMNYSAQSCERAVARVDPSSTRTAQVLRTERFVPDPKQQWLQFGCHR